MGDLEADLLVSFILWTLRVLHAATSPSVDDPWDSGEKHRRDAAVVLSVEDYRNLADAPYAGRDGDAVERFLREGLHLSRYRVQRVRDGARKDFYRAIRRAAARVRRGGTLWIWFSGHGVALSDQWYLLTATAPLDALDMETHAVSLAEIRRWTDRTRAGRVVVVVDAGFDGTGRLGEDLIPGVEATTSAFRPEPSERYAWWLGAGRGGGVEVWPEVEHGLFTWLALGALRGWGDGASGDPPDGRVSLVEAQDFVARTIDQLGRTQSPALVPEPDWVLVDGQLQPDPGQALWLELGRRNLQERIARARRELREEVELEYAAALRAATAGDLDPLRAFVVRHEGTTLVVEWAEWVPELDMARRYLRHPERLPAPVADAGGGGPAGGKATGEAADGAPAAPQEAGAPAGEATGTPPAEEEEPVVAEVEEPEPEEPDLQRPDTCEDLQGLEQFALMGMLGDDLVACLEAALAAADRQTVRSRISRLLLADAEARQDLDAWGELARRHLETIEQSDPDLCFKYALYLSRQGPEHGEEVIRWADTALENKQVWSRTTYKRRLYDLYRLRAETAYMLWSDHEAAYARTFSDEDEALARRWRNEAKEYAREWLDYAVASSQPADKAYKLCTAAAGTASFCETGG